MAIIGMAIGIILLLRDAQAQDALRKNIIRFYILGAAGLLTVYLWRWNKARRSDNRKLSAANIILFGSLAFVVLCVIGCIVAIGPTIPRAAPAAPIITDTPTPIFIDTPIASATPTLPSLQATPTDIPAGSNPFYTEEFDGNLDTWVPFMTSGIESQVDLSFGDGKLTLHLSPHEDKIPWYYLINTASTYADVQVEAIVSNTGNNANGVSLICRLSDKGWYEFWLSSSGYYAIYAFDGAGNTYNELFTGGSPAIHAGLSTNVYTAICKGDELALLVNGEQIRSVTDIRFGLPEGNIGIGASSPQTLPVDLEFESVTVSEP